MPDFQGSKSIILQPGDIGVPYTFTWTICTSSTGNDGAIPYGHTVSTVATNIHHENTISYTTALLAASSHNVTVTTIFLSYPTSSGFISGKYHATFTATISDGTTTFLKTFDFNRIIVKDK